MKITHILALAMVCGFIGGCETTGKNTGADKANAASSSMNREFVAMYGGQGEVHKYSGLQCSNILGDMQFDSSHMYNPKGTDVSCGWREGADRRYVTVYATRRPNASFKAHWKGTLTVVNQVEGQRGLTLDEEKSTACALAGLISAAAGSQLKGEGISDIFALEAAVFTDDVATSVVTYHPAPGGWMLKVRSTRPAGAGRSDENHYLEMCLEASEVTQSQSANIARAGWK